VAGVGGETLDQGQTDDARTRPTREDHHMEVGMNTQMSIDRLAQLRGTPVYDSAGEKIGKVDEIFYDLDTREPEWIGIGTGFFGSKRVLVPVYGASVGEDRVTVAYAKDQVKDSPNVDGDEVSESTERDLYAYYGLQPSESTSDSQLPRGQASAGETEQAAVPQRQTDVGSRREGDVIRSEEQLNVGKREVEAGRVRLRKWVETEPVEASVELERERVRVSREAIDEPGSGAQIGEDEVEMTIREERPVVEKETVARERISLDKDVERRQETVSDEVRKERVEIEGDVDDTAR
jgi:uncharacterized protein (TIGR02271 family)